MGVFELFSLFQIATLYHFCLENRVSVESQRCRYQQIAIHVGYRFHQSPFESDQPLLRYVRFAGKSLAFLTSKIATLYHFYCGHRLFFVAQFLIDNMIDIHSGFKTRRFPTCFVHPMMRSKENSKYVLFL